ncbi:thioredoxin-like protein [Anaerobacterium chartisolvens]|uniref:Thioredoxin-like protein n=1 Tax=Anaerobacterium chartisolvens TaxID=1297424 RepID=A0A369AKJ7_9FIRM|nr:(2Fe-2S) ferredoxin domain-containing protein [Anaerobacterium chartisolvens]RCX09633.1 thioredoxin-like protein [Anaerobacterium chartisolvens]
MLNIYVCVGSACHIKGSYNLISTIQQTIDTRKISDRVTVKAALCLGNCTGAVSVRVDDEEVLSVEEKDIKDFFNKHIMNKL